MICEKCGKEFFEDWRKSTRKRGACRFCSQHCSCVRNPTKEVAKKRADSLRLHPEKFCPRCGKKILWHSSFCRQCSSQNKREKALKNLEEKNRLRKIREEKSAEKNKKQVRKNIEIRNFLIEKLGGKCIICGYNKSTSALDFHHKNKEEKLFGISRALAHKNKEVLEKEIEKCVLLCCRCHRELHANLISLPE